MAVSDSRRSGLAREKADAALIHAELTIQSVRRCRSVWYMDVVVAGTVWSGSRVGMGACMVAR